jgi:hypothetical protein
MGDDPGGRAAAEELEAQREMDDLTDADFEAERR